MKFTFASFFGDLASCFDRMKTSLSSVVAIRKGMPRSVCLSRSRTIRQMKMRVRTAAGTSTEHYSGGPGELDLDGEIQGTATAMTLWTLKSSTILSTHNTLCRGVTLRHVATEATSHQCADAYVDDTDVLEAAGDDEVIYEDTDEGDTAGLWEDGAELAVLQVANC